MEYLLGNNTCFYCSCVSGYLLIIEGVLQVYLSYRSAKYLERHEWLY